MKRTATVTPSCVGTRAIDTTIGRHDVDLHHSRDLARYSARVLKKVKRCYAKR